MFINIRFNKTNVAKCLFILIAIVLIIFFLISTYRIFSESISNSNEKNTEVLTPEVIKITAENYTNVLKAVHDDLNSYVGKKICFSGYIYRASDFNENQFVLARDMVISSDLKTLVVGFLCECKNIKSFENNTWVEITGTITKGKYIEEIPIINITDIKAINKPEKTYVYPPDESFVPTINIF